MTGGLTRLRVDAAGSSASGAPKFWGKPENVDLESGQVPSYDLPTGR
jgi:hypothetical protein